MDDPDLWGSVGTDLMQFRLTYEGPLRSTQRDPEGEQTDPRHAHKHAIRKVFHQQLKQLWEVNENLSGAGPAASLITFGQPPSPPKTAAELAAVNQHYGWSFVPLVTEPMSLTCSLDILFLRRTRPGKLLQSGDIDNRLKTLFDALTVPTPHDRYTEKTPAEGESPLFVLLEDDRLVTRVSVETDQLLVPPQNPASLDDVHLIVNVTVRPYVLSLDNFHLA